MQHGIEVKDKQQSDLKIWRNWSSSRLLRERLHSNNKSKAQLQKEDKPLLLRQCSKAVKVLVVQSEDLDVNTHSTNDQLRNWVD